MRALNLHKPVRRRLFAAAVLLLLLLPTVALISFEFSHRSALTSPSFVHLDPYTSPAAPVPAAAPAVAISYPHFDTTSITDALRGNPNNVRVPVLSPASNHPPHSPPENDAYSPHPVKIPTQSSSGGAVHSDTAAHPADVIKQPVKLPETLPHADNAESEPVRSLQHPVQENHPAAPPSADHKQNAVPQTVHAKAQPQPQPAGDHNTPANTAAVRQPSYSVRGFISPLVRQYLQQIGYRETKHPPARAPFVLYRAIGNDLPPRHAPGHTFNNVAFVLRHEPIHESLDARWYLNRIVDQTQELQLVKLLVNNSQTFVVDSINWDEYAKIDVAFFKYGKKDPIHGHHFKQLSEDTQNQRMQVLLHDKNRFIMHNNEARNFMIDEALNSGATYALPWDANCFLSLKSWQNVTEEHAKAKQIAQNATKLSTKYFQVPTVRLQNNDPLLRDEDLKSSTEEVPHLIFHLSAKERFNNDMRYGRRSKVELLWRLQISGPWSRLSQVEQPGEKKVLPSTDVSGEDTIAKVGWVSRLHSDHEILGDPSSSAIHGELRSQGIETLLANADLIAARKHLNYTENTLMMYDESKLEQNKALFKNESNMALNRLVKDLLSSADEELKRNARYTVSDKPHPGPSGDVHDYVSLAPYFWPDTNKPDGIPYIQRDGERQPSAELYGKGSEKYDRTRMTNFARNTTILALAGYFSGEKRYSDRAAEYLRTWFIHKNTRMTPRLLYGLMRFQKQDSIGESPAILETVLFGTVLDSIRLLTRANSLSLEELAEIKKWFHSYADWLEGHEFSATERHRDDHHGSLYDLQMACISAFTGNALRLARTTSFARARLLDQIEKDGSMPHELRQPDHVRLHSMLNGYQAFVLLGSISQKVGVDFWQFGMPEGDPLMKSAAEYLLPYTKAEWDHPVNENDDMERMHFIYFSLRDRYPKLNSVDSSRLASNVIPLPKSVFEVKPLFHSSHLVPEYWNLAMSE